MRTLLAVLALSSVALAAKAPVDPISKNGQGVAAKGYDVVAYFTEGKPVKGAEQFTFSWSGATWWFQNAQSRDLFAANPAKYAPQYGGYCAYAVSEGYTAEIDPEAWRIVEGKLYLNYSKNVQKKWAETLTERIGKADRNWPGLHK